MATWSVLTGRKLKPGAYDDWRKAWWTDEDEVPEGANVYILRKVGDPDEVIAFGLIEATQDELEAMRPDSTAEQARQGRMAPHIDSVFADGMYEVVEHIKT